MFAFLWPTPLLCLAGRLAQLGERLPYKQEVGGSIPSPPIAEYGLFKPFLADTDTCLKPRSERLASNWQVLLWSPTARVSRADARSRTGDPFITSESRSRLTRRFLFVHAGLLWPEMDSFGQAVLHRCYTLSRCEGAGADRCAIYATGHNRRRDSQGRL
jgi:hypothetical protein